MKRLFFILSTAFLSLTFSKAQVLNWDTAHIGGMGNGNMQFKSAAVYNGTFYLGAGDNSSALSKLFWSNDGFSWDTLMSYTLSKDPADNNISNIDTAAGRMFFTADNNINGGQFYEMNGTTANYQGQPPFAGGVASGFSEVGAMKIFNVGGVDSIYIAYNNYTNGAEIWKTSVAQPHGWTLALATEDSIGGIFDLAMFNGKIYAAAQLGYIFESSDGVNWAINSTSSNGFGNNSVDCFNVLSVFNNKLFVGTASWSAAVSVWSTADGITWDSLLLTNVTQASLSAISHFTTVGSTLWMTVNGDYGSAFAAQSGMQTMGMSFGPIVFESVDGGLTFDRRSVNNFGEFNNDGVYKLTLYKNNLFASGPSLYGEGGRVYHTCLAPNSSISETLAFDTTCVGMSPTFFGTTNGSQNNWWYDDAFPVANAQNTSITFSTPGTHVVKLISYNYACVDSVTKNIFVNPSFNIDSVTTPSAIVCVNNLMSLSVYHSTGTAPHTYNWDDGFGPIGTTQSITISTTAMTGSVSTTVTDYFGCTAFSLAPSVTVLNSTPIYGTINYSSGAVTNGNMFLIAQGASSALYDTVMTQAISGSGDYSVSGLTAGNYYIRAEANAGSYPTLVNTYFGDHYLWDSAIVVSHGCTQTDTFNILMVELPGTTGPGSIHGTVYEGVGFGQKLILGPGVMANVIPGVPVKVGKNPGGAIVAGTMTDASGQYDFSGLPYDNYRIYTDIPGYPMDSSYAVTLAAGSDSLVNLDYFVDSNSVYIDLTTSIHNLSEKNENSALTVHPNPTTGAITLLKYFKEDATIQLFVSDMSGKNVLAKFFSAQANAQFVQQLDLSFLEKGVYMLRTIQNGKTNITKVIIY